MRRLSLYAALILGLTHPVLALAADDEEDINAPKTEDKVELPTPKGKASWFAPTRGDAGPRNVYWRPLVSVLLPGFDQYLAGHTTSAVTYTGVWAAASIWNEDRSKKWDDFEEDSSYYKSLSKEEKNDYRGNDELGRQKDVSGIIAQDIGFLSAYHSFRTSVATRQDLGQYGFLKHEETPQDLLLAPFQFKYILKPTTFIPLAIVAGLSVAQNQNLPKDRERRSYTSSDTLYSSAISYNAGVSEEAFFRGYLHPLMTEAWNYSPTWANLAQASIFALAHISSTDAPVAQFGLGYYLGWLSERNEWTISEGIFIHTWWDVVALTSSYLSQRKVDPQHAVIWTPAFRMAF